MTNERAALGAHYWMNHYSYNMLCSAQLTDGRQRDLFGGFNNVVVSFF